MAGTLKVFPGTRFFLIPPFQNLGLKFVPPPEREELILCELSQLLRFVHALNKVSFTISGPVHFKVNWL